MPDLKAQPKDTTVLLDPLNKMLTDPEGNYQSPRKSTCKPYRQTAIHKLKAHADDAENQSRWNNLLSYGLPNPSALESSMGSEGHCSDCLNVRLETKEIDWMGRCNCKHPIIHLSSKKQRKSSFPMSITSKALTLVDFSWAVRNTRKHLVAFAKDKSVPYSHHFKTLFIGAKCYIQ